MTRTAPARAPTGTRVARAAATRGTTSGIDDRSIRSKASRRRVARSLTRASALAPEDGLQRARAFLAGPGRAFAVLHLSRLEYVGMESGWLSAPYRAKAAEIDRSLEALFSEIERRGSFFLVVTSDHAGHAREHGTDHPEDGKLPLVMGSDRVRLPDIQGKRYEIAGLRALLAPLFLGPGR